MEEWNNGIMEWWEKKMVFPILHYSIIPIFRFFLCGLRGLGGEIFNFISP